MPVAVLTYGYSPEAVWGLGADKVLERFDALPAALAELASTS